MDEQKQNTTTTPIAELKPKMHFEGAVVKTELFGALVDIGAEQPGLLHISQMQVEGKERVNRVADVFEVGSKVKVWIRGIEPDRGLISLTMFEPLRYDWDDLKRDLQVAGKVTSVTDFGAFVNFGGPRDGLIPAGQLSRERINKPSDVVSEGQEIVAYIISVDEKRERIGLSMVEPAALPWEQIRKGHTYKGKVTRLERFGAFVDIGAERDGLVHVSELTSGYIQEPSEAVSVGQEVEVKVLDVNRRKRQIQLSMKETEQQAQQAEAEGEEEEEELPTSMEQAYQSAQRLQQKDARGRRSSTEDRQRQEQMKIMKRTLEHHQSRS